MLGLAAFLIGAFVGAIRARRMQGNRLDILQWAVVTGLIFWLIAVIVPIFLLRLGWL